MISEAEWAWSMQDFGYKSDFQEPVHLVRAIRAEYRDEVIRVIGELIEKWCGGVTEYRSIFKTVEEQLIAAIKQIGTAPVEVEG